MGNVDESLIFTQTVLTSRYKPTGQMLKNAASDQGQ